MVVRYLPNKPNEIDGKYSAISETDDSPARHSVAFLANLFIYLFLSLLVPPLAVKKSSVDHGALANRM